LAPYLSGNLKIKNLKLPRLIGHIGKWRMFRLGLKKRFGGHIEEGGRRQAVWDISIKG